MRFSFTLPGYNLLRDHKMDSKGATARVSFIVLCSTHDTIKKHFAYMAIISLPITSDTNISNYGKSPQVSLENSDARAYEL